MTITFARSPSLARGPDWMIFRLLGDFSTIGRFFDYCAIFRLLGDFSTIGRFFDYWAIFSFGSFFWKIETVSPIFGLFIFSEKLRIHFDKKTGRAPFRPNFSQAHLVILFPSKNMMS
jgi:hypothetical protein